MDFAAELKLIAICVMDMAFGDPRWLPHPVRLMGMLIHRYVRFILRRCQSPITKRIAGVVLAVGLPCGCYLVVYEVIRFMEQVHEAVGMVTWIIFGYTTIAARDLWDHAMRVFRAFEQEMLIGARRAVGQLVGRDTDKLSDGEIVRATVESIAENTSDGIVAPLCYLAVGGPPLAMAYKAVNTLDSMIGYRNDRYRDVGWASARLDDVVNWIPARLTAVGISVAAALRLGQGRIAWRMCWRDAGKHLSPNSGWPESAMAGALGIQLGGMNEYEGIGEKRAKLGDPNVPLTSSLIPLALQIMLLSSACIVCVLLTMVVQ